MKAIPRLALPPLAGRRYVGPGRRSAEHRDKRLNPRSMLGRLGARRIPRAMPRTVCCPDLVASVYIAGTRRPKHYWRVEEIRLGKGGRPPRMRPTSVYPSPHLAGGRSKFIAMAVALAGAWRRRLRTAAGRARRSRMARKSCYPPYRRCAGSPPTAGSGSSTGHGRSRQSSRAGANACGSSGRLPHLTKRTGRPLASATFVRSRKMGY